MRPAEYPELENCLVEWVKQCLSNNVPVNGPLIKQKEREYETKLKIEDFCASNGWLDGFKNKWFVTKKICGESKTVDDSVYNTWIKDLPALMKNYSDNMF